jgi:hypothetical protein
LFFGRTTRIHSGICVATVAFLFVSLFGVGLLQAQDQRQWKQHFSDKMICSLNLTQALVPGTLDEPECLIRDHPSLLTDYWIALVVVGSGILSSCWTLNRATLETWRRWLLLRLLDDSQLRLQPTIALKNELIARSYKNREQPAGREYTPSLRSLHDDPVRMDLGSATPERLSASFVNQLPNLLSRRGAVYKDTFKDSHLLHTYPLHVHKLLGNVAGDNGLKPFAGLVNDAGLPMSGGFVSVGGWSDASQHLHASIDSFATHSLDSNQTQRQLNLAAHQQKRKTRRERDAGLTHKNFKARHAQLLASMSRRRESDTSSIASMMNGKQSKSSAATCKATSTGDLPPSVKDCQTVPDATRSTELNPPIGLHPASSTSVMVPNLSSAAMYSNNFMLNPMHPATMTNPTGMTRSMRRRSTQALPEGAYAFMHGMSERDSRADLANPFSIKRRPDSVNKTIASSTTTTVQATQRPPSGSMASAFHCDGSNLQIQNSSNTVVAAVNSRQFSPMHLPMNQTMSNHVPYSTVGHYPYHPANPYAPMYGNPSSMMAPGAPMPSHPSAMPFAPYLNPMQGQMYAANSAYGSTTYNNATSGLMAARAAQRTYKTLEDLQQDMREREAIVRICQGVDSASEANESMFPIALSDTDGFMTDASGRRTRLSRTSNSAQRIVRARIQQVQSDQQANVHSTLNGGELLLPLDLHDQPTDPIEAPINADDSTKKIKKKKKKSSKKRVQ